MGDIEVNLLWFNSLCRNALNENDVIVAISGNKYLCEIGRAHV